MAFSVRFSTVCAVLLAVALAGLHGEMAVQAQDDEACTVSPPEGWVTYAVQEGDTLQLLAARFQVRTTRLVAVNCLPSIAAMSDPRALDPAFLDDATMLFVPPNIPVFTMAERGAFFDNEAAARCEVQPLESKQCQRLVTSMYATLFESYALCFTITSGDSNGCEAALRALVDTLPDTP
jgi:hypothetical protein